jgi:glycosyltransferase involved in cell wall biosynthesis
MMHKLRTSQSFFCKKYKISEEKLMTAFFTMAYNSEKTIKRTIESMLNQTCPDWVWFLYENGSADGTRKIIEEYSAKDKRIIPAYVDKNNVDYCWLDGIGKIKNSNADYFATLDADDEYCPEFLEKSLNFAKKHDCDLVCVGVEYLRISDNKRTHVYVSESDVVLNNDNFEAEFYKYIEFTYSFWAKLYSVNLIHIFDPENFKIIDNGTDTYIATLAFKYSKIVGFIGEVLHHYYLLPKTEKNIWLEKMSVCPSVIDDTYREIMIEKCGTVNKANDEYFNYAYMYFLTRAMGVLINSDEDISVKITGLCDMFLNEKTYALAEYEYFGKLHNKEESWNLERARFFNAVTKWLLELKQADIPEAYTLKYAELGEFVAAAAENVEGWVTFYLTAIEYLLKHKIHDEARERIKVLLQVLPENEEIKNLAKLFL